ncbi:Periplasmic copper-binding protein (NosD) [Candidatus Methanoperedenaceae archaeon GB37]|nr:Periplasmic copper-binding protein (NosD) [Candidatus Methanoperedenaceae archaeon GB37]
MFASHLTIVRYEIGYSESPRRVSTTRLLTLVLILNLYTLILCNMVRAAEYGEINVTTANDETWSTLLSNNASIVTGDIIVTSGALELSNATIRLNCTGDGEYKIDVREGGVLNLTNNSLVSVNNTKYRYNWWYRKGSSGSLKGSTIEYCGYDGGSYGLNIRADGILIENCTIEYNYYGIFLNSSNNTVISNTTVSDSYYGIYLSNSHGNNLTKNTADGNTRYGIYMKASPSNTLTDNRADQNRRYGIYLYSSNSNNIRGSRTDSNGDSSYGSGIHLFDSSNNTLTDNTANSNNNYGIYVSGENNTLSNNTAGSNSYGIYIEGSSNISVRESRADGNTNHGIHLSSSNAIDLINNTVSNSRYGVYLDSSEECTLEGNNMTDNTRYGLYVTSGYENDIDQSNLVNGKKVYYYYNNDSSLRIDQNDVGHVTLASCSNFVIRDSTIDDGDGIRLVTSSNITIINNTLLNNYYGIELSSSDSNNLTDNNASNNNYGIYMTSSSQNEIVNNTVTSNDHDGIYLASSHHNNLTNNRVSWNPDSGFRLSSSSYNLLSNNTVSSSSDGIYLDSSENNDIRNSTVLDTVHGYYIESSSNNNLTDNNITGSTHTALYIVNDYDNAIDPYSNTVDGEPVYYYYNYTSVEIKNNDLAAYNVSNLGRISLIDCADFVIENNTIKNRYHGIYLKSSDNITIIENNLTEIRENGLYLISSSNNNISGNHLPSCGNDGIHLSSSSHNVIDDNDASGSGRSGIYVASSHNNDLERNNVSKSGDDGVHITSSRNNTIEEIVASNCDSYGIYLLSSSNNTISDCITNRNDRGIYLGASENNSLMNNTASSNTYFGFYLDGSDYNTLVNNTACSSTTYYGVYLHSSDHINFTDGNLSKNADHGLRIDASSEHITIINTSICSNGGRGIMLESDHNNITENNISYNGGNGLHLSHSDYNEIERNTILNNTDTGIAFVQSSNNNVTWNSILNNSDNGVHFISSSRFNELIANTIEGSGVYDVYIESSDNNTITQTKAQLNNYDFYLDGSTEACILDTAFNESRYGLTDSATLTVRWYLDVWVTDSLYIKNMAGSSVTFRYNETGGNATIFTGITGTDGRLSSYYDTLPNVTQFTASPTERVDHGVYANATTLTNQTGYNDTDYQVKGKGATLIVTTGWIVNTRCYYCHEDKKKFELTQHANDTIGSDARNCTYCHNETDTEAIPHGRSSGPNLLAVQSPWLCYNGSDNASGSSCHGIGSPYGDQYTEFQSITAHPVNDGNISCKTCHDNHGDVPENVTINGHTKEWKYDLVKYYYTGTDTLSNAFDGYFSEAFDLCYTCHLEENILNTTTQKTNFWENGTGTMQPNYHQGHISYWDGMLSPGCRNCHNPHGSDIPRMNRNQSVKPGSSATGGFFGFINNSTYPAYLLNEANGYDIPDDWYNESLNRGGAITSDPEGYCQMECHSAGSEPYNTSEWGSYGRDMLSITPTGGPDCTECHDNSNPDAIRPMVNVTAMKLGMHAGVNSDCNITYWAERRGFDASSVSEDNKICWGCHATNGTPPYPNYHPDRTLNPYKCAKCHGEYQPPHVNASNPDVTHSATIIKNHGPTTKGAGSIRIQTDPAKGGSCEDCHYPSRITDIGELKTRYCTDDGVWHWKSYNETTILGNTSHYGLNSTGGMLMNETTNSTSCIYCHCNETNSAVWGNATIVDMETHSGGVSTNQECYGCHVIGNHPDDPVEDLTIPGNFHNETLYSGGGPDCIVCHDKGNPYGFTETNATSVNNGIHQNVTENAYEQIDVNDSSKPCWGCHQSDGFQPEGMGDRYDDPWRCEDCHTPSAEWNAATMNGYTWSADGSPLPPRGIVEHSPNSTDVTTNVVGNGTCADCHNNSIDPYHNDTDERLLGNTLDANVSHYGRWVSLETLNCLYCHNSSTNGTRWGGATQIYASGTMDMYNATENSECYACHIDYGVAMPDDFHESPLNWGGGPNCTMCHDTSTDSGFNAGFGVDSGVNVSSVASTSVHRRINQNATDPGNTWTQEDWSGGIGESTSTQYNGSLNISATSVVRLETISSEENDTFTDTSEIASSSNVTISGGDVSLSTGSTTGNLTSTLIAPQRLGGWGTFHANDTLNWKYRRAVTIENTGGPLTDYQVRINVTYDSDMKSDFSDLRFTDSDGSILPYWIEEYTEATSAVLWVKIPEIPSQKTIYMHYGNPSATSESSIHDTFLFGDDFENASLTNASINKTTYPSQQYVENGVYHINGSSGEEVIAEINSTQFPDDYIVEAIVRWIDSTNGSIYLSPRYHDEDERYVSSLNETDLSIKRVDSGKWSNLATESLDTNISAGINYTFITAVRKTASTNELTARAMLSDATIGQIQANDSTLEYTNLSFSGRGNDTFHIHIDDLRVRRYSEREPTASIGAEERGDEIVYEILNASNCTLATVSNGSLLSSITARSIRLRATLKTLNASFTPVLHDWGVTWYYYKSEGNLTSAAYSTGENYSFSTIRWDGSLPENTGMRFRLRSGATESLLYSAPWYGPTGTDDYYTASGEEINPIHDNDQWIQYRVYLNTSDGNETPRLDDIAITYTTSYHQYYPFDSRNKICWACHDTDGEYVGAMGDRYNHPWNCSDCHIEYETRWNTWNDSTSPPLVVEHQPSAPNVQTNVNGNGTCADCHNNSIDPHHNDTREAVIGNTLKAIASHYALNRSFGMLINTTDCLYCHYTENETALKWGNATNITLGTNFVHTTDLGSDIYTNNSRCYDCHVTTKEAPEKPYFHSETLFVGGGPDCIACHDTGMDATNINATSIRNGMHGDLNDPGASEYQESVSCWVCHGDGTEPVGHPENVRDPLYCGYCHATSSGYTYASLFGSPPRVYDHIPPPYAENIRTNISGAPNGTCEYCHNNSIDPYHNDTDESIIGNTLKAIASHYGLNSTHGMLMTHLNNTTDCLYCHNNTPENITWGGAKIVTHEQNYNNSNCYECHDTTGLMPVTFHAESMSSGGGGDCIKCHDTGSSAEHRINVTAVASGVHANVNNNTTNSTHIPASNKKCWGCHQSDGREPTSDMGDIVRTPYQCWDCHNGTAPHINLSNATAVHEHFRSGGEIDALQNEDNNTWSCLGCHNMSEMKVSFIEDDPYGSRVSYVSHYARNYTELSTLRNLTNSTRYCQYCHNNSSVIFNPFIDPSCQKITHGSNCSRCHGAGKIHDAALKRGGGTDCLGCHGSLESTIVEVYYVNATLFNESVHHSVNCTDCHTSTGYSEHSNDHPSEEYGWKWCECCHSYQSDFLNETDRHNVTDTPGESILSSTNCTACHDETGYYNATRYYNSSAEHECRWCHILPDKIFPREVSV